MPGAGRRPRPLPRRPTRPRPADLRRGAPLAVVPAQPPRRRPGRRGRADGHRGDDYRLSFAVHLCAMRPRRRHCGRRRSRGECASRAYPHLRERCISCSYNSGPAAAPGNSDQLATQHVKRGHIGPGWTALMDAACFHRKWSLLLSRSSQGYECGRCDRSCDRQPSGTSAGAGRWCGPGCKRGAVA